MENKVYIVINTNGRIANGLFFTDQERADNYAEQLNNPKKLLTKIRMCIVSEWWFVKELTKC